MASVKREPSSPRMLELLAPRFSDVGGAGGSIPVSLDLSATLDVQLVFWERSVTRQLECVNVDEGCPRCKFESFLRGLVILKRRGLLHINGAYVVDAAEPGFALLRLQVEGCEAIAEASNVDEFKFVTSHLRRSSASETTETQLQAIETAKRSLCHVVGCKLHRWKTPRAQVTPERVLPVAVAVAASVSAPARARAPVPVPSPDRIRDPVRTPVPVLPPTVASFTDPTLTDSMMLVKTETQVPAPTSPAAEVEEPSFSDSAESYEVEGEVPTEPPPNRKLNLPDVFYSLMARIEANPSKLWSADIPGLDLRLYEHQQRGLSWMMKRERAALWDTVLPHPFNVPGKQSGQNERNLEEEFSETAHDVCGGMLCDEPGLGKTITMLALILLTKGQSTKDMPVRVDAPTSNTASVQLRSTSRGPSLRGEDLVSSAACLIVVPDALVEHWEEQIEAHVVHNGLKTYVDKATKEQGDLPQCTKLAKYDVVITSFSRMAKEWKLHRPPSALETQSISRYGFEDQPDRYLDGSLRGHVSSLLSVHWLRVVVDEGHKLGGRAPTQLMQMSRLLCAERRWVMTGTPSPNTLQSADLQYLHGLLVFLRNQPYGRPDGYAWSKAIARPFEQNKVIGSYRLQHLLGRIMIRHTKESIRDQLPRPIRHTVIVDPTPSEFKLYNAVAERVRANLVATSIDLPERKATGSQQRASPDNVHPKSLLHRQNRPNAGYVETALILSFMGGYAVDWTVKDGWKKGTLEKTITRTIDKLRKLGVNESRISEVTAYLNGILLTKKTRCADCGSERRFMMVLPCGHLCCAFCVQDMRKEAGECLCNFCEDPYDEDEFDYLQPTRTGEITDQGRENTLTKLRASGVNELRIERVIAYMDTLKSKPTTECRSCRRELHLLLILPCGHFCCPNCVEKRYQETGPSCCLCHAPYSRKEFYKLQPGIYPTALDEDGDKRGQRKKMAVDKKRKQTTQRAKKTVRLVNVKRDFWKIESSKIFYMATRVRELKKMFSQSSRGRQRELKVIIFSQYRESIWRTKVAFKQQNIPTADFIALVNPRQRIKNLKKFRSKSNLNVLLLSSLGSHGLDLSFVTHIFLLEEIWDKSVEMQVISRAHRMGASASVVVEQLWMRGTVECQLTSMNQHLFNSEQSTEDGDSMTQPTREEVQESSSADKGSFQKMKYNYILNNLRVLENGICGKENEVRFSVVDENETVIRHGVHAISDSGNVTTVSTKPSTAQRCPAPTITSSASKSPPRSNPPTTEISRQKPNAPEVIVIDDSSSDEEHKSQANESDREDDIRVPSLKTRRRTGPVKQEPVYIEIKDEETESE